MLIVAAVLMTVLGMIYIAGRERNKKKVLVFKAMATLVADLLAVANALETGAFPAWCFAVGIFLYACADILLEIKFMAGVICFGAGHICLIAGLLGYTAPDWITGVVWVLECTVAFVIFRPYLKRLKKLKVPVCIYTMILCGMSAMNVTLAFAEPDFGTGLRAVGSICFLISDGIIGWNFVHHRRSRSSGAVLMILYYLAVYLLAAAFYI